MAEKIYRIVGGVPTEIGARDPTRRYRMRHVAGEMAYIEFTSQEEIDRTAEEALPQPPFAGLGRVAATRANQSIPSATPTPIDFTTELYDVGDYHGAGNPDRFVVGPAQGGLFDIKGWVRFNESSAGAGGTANAGDRVAQLRVAGAAVIADRRRASAGGDTEIPFATEIELAAGDIVRVGVLQNCGGAMNVDARISLRRVG